MWGDPRIRTKQSALNALPQAPDAFSPSDGLVELAVDLANRSEIAIDPELSEARDRLLFLAVRRTNFVDSLSWLVGRCRELGLVIFDPEGERVIEPRASARQATAAKNVGDHSEVMEALRTTELSGDLVEDQTRLTERAIRATGGRLASSLLPSRVVIPFDVPSPLRFMVPDSIPAARQSRAARKRHLDDLADSRGDVRRVAAFELAGWAAPDADIDGRLQGLLETESDNYVRAVVALSLSLRGVGDPDALVDAAEHIVAEAERPGAARFDGMAASMAVLAAMIGAEQHSADTGARIHELIARVRSVEGERLRGEALATVSSEYFA